MLIFCKGNSNDYIKISDEFIHPRLLEITIMEEIVENTVLLDKEDIVRIIKHLNNIIGEQV